MINADRLFLGIPNFSIINDGLHSFALYFTPSDQYCGVVVGQIRRLMLWSQLPIFLQTYLASAIVSWQIGQHLAKLDKPPSKIPVHLAFYINLK